MMYSVSSELYHRTADRLRDAIDAESYFSGTLAFSYEGMECRLTTSVIVYRNRVEQPEGVVQVITDLVPVWWEFHTFPEEGEERLNDFDFTELKRYL